jgi:hypothetical protein
MQALASALLALFLSSCTNPDTGESYTLEQSINQVQVITIKLCKFEPDASVVAAVLTAANPTVVGISAVAHAICHVVTTTTIADAFGISTANAQEAGSTQSCPADEQVNGVCIRGKRTGD